MDFLKNIFAKREAIDLQKIIDEGAFLVDVRTPSEFDSGHVKGSVNIPLDTIRGKLAKFKNKKNIIVFCKSGGRSMMAKQLLDQNGIENVINGGTWVKISQYVK